VIATICEAAIALSLLATIGGLVWAALRASMVAARISKISRRRATRAISGLGSQIERAMIAADGLRGADLPFGEIWTALASAAASAFIFRESVEAAARATEELLEATVPSMRGRASD
jgi:hypothetical protein